MADSAWRRHWRWVFLPVTLGALAWTVWLLWGSLPELRENLPKLKVRWLLWVLIGNTLSGYLSFEAFRALFNRMRPAAYGRLALAHLYFTGQLMKHLPGRIWGVAYQSSAGPLASLAEWVSVTAIYMVLTTGFALWVAATVVGFMFHWEWGLLAIAAGSVIYALLWQPHPLGIVLTSLRKVRLRAIARLCDALQPFVAVDVQFKRTVWLWFVAGWVVYLLAWIGYGLAWPNLTASDGIWLCAMYTLAWFVGYISVVSPSGVGVRELVFVLLAHDFSPDAVAGTAILGRVMLLGVDVILGGAFLSFRPTGGDGRR